MSIPVELLPLLPLLFGPRNFLIGTMPLLFGSTRPRTSFQGSPQITSCSISLSATQAPLPRFDIAPHQTSQTLLLPSTILSAKLWTDGVCIQVIFSLHSLKVNLSPSDFPLAFTPPWIFMPTQFTPSLPLGWYSISSTTDSQTDLATSTDSLPVFEPPFAWLPPDLPNHNSSTLPSSPSAYQAPQQRGLTLEPSIVPPALDFT
jgi:hypothetical protein